MRRLAPLAWAGEQEGTPKAIFPPCFKTVVAQLPHIHLLLLFKPNIDSSPMKLERNAGLEPGVEYGASSSILLPDSK